MCVQHRKKSQPSQRSKKHFVELSSRCSEQILCLAWWGNLWFIPHSFFCSLGSVVSQRVKEPLDLRSPIFNQKEQRIDCHKCYLWDAGLWGTLYNFESSDNHHKIVTNPWGDFWLKKLGFHVIISSLVNICFYILISCLVSFRDDVWSVKFTKGRLRLAGWRAKLLARAAALFSWRFLNLLFLRFLDEVHPWTSASWLKNRAIIKAQRPVLLWESWLFLFLNFF